MSITVEKTASQTSIIKVQLKKEDYEKKVNDTVKKLSKQVALKGFRPGMAPLGLVKKMYGGNVIVEEVNKLLNEKIIGYIQENKVDVLGQPMPSKDQPFLDLDINNIKDVEFAYEIGHAPEVSFKYLDSKPTFTKYMVTVEDKMINEEVERMRSRFAKYEYPENVEEKDVLMFTIEELDEAGNVKEDGLKNVTSLAMDMFKADVHASLLNLKKHDSLDLNIWESLDREQDEILKHVLAVKEGEKPEVTADKFRFTLNNITRSMPADLNEEFFVKAYGEAGPKSEQEMRDLIKTDLEAYFSGQGDSYLVNELHNTIMEKVELALPDEFLKRWVKASNEKEISDEQIEAEYPLFAKQIKWNLIVKKVVNEQGYNVSQEELAAKVRTETISQMYSYGLRNIGDDMLDQFVNKQMADKQYTDKMAERILDEKALDYIKSKVAVAEKPISFDEFKTLVEGKKI
jgi:trigger factor